MLHFSQNNNCMLDDAAVFDEDLYNQHTGTLPGQRYSPDQQCEQKYGQGAKYCGVCTNMYY